MEVCHTGQCVTIFGGAARISEVPHGTRHLELHQPPDRSAAPTRSMWSLVSPGRDLFGGVSVSAPPSENLRNVPRYYEQPTSFASRVGVGFVGSAGLVELPACPRSPDRPRE